MICYKSPLKSLTGLRRIVFDHNQIQDLSSLSTMTHLYVLINLSDNQISDISPLASLNPGTLNLSHNQITDISPLASLTNLRRLELSYNQISDISPLESLTNLTILKLKGNPIREKICPVKADSSPCAF
jgi:internalin A